ncbi:MAG: hypothetical protein H6737_10570 [Alphaproteobacteria bacterium]|nr:hypothetical protein [Alphaproteobacteria bacterium]
MILLLSLALGTHEEPDGAELFARQWVEADPRSAGGDGLGPTYNDSSCTACHNQGGAGGAGPAAKNVRLTVRGGATVVLHRRHLAGIPEDERRMRPASLPIRMQPPVERNTPALFGMGLLDAIPESELLVAEALGSPGHPEISGRLARDPHGRVGRFGWKGQTPTLAAFVEQACSNELGLQTETTDQPGAPSLPDMDDPMLFALAGFVADLPAPVEVPTPGAERGREVFVELGCEGCHRASIGGVQGAYTDLMLHDMGFQLSDAASGYGLRAKAADTGASEAEWRTPPLWGLRDSAPWLHDGRATTIREVVLHHDGEAAPARRAWARAGEADQQALETFLMSLAAPGTPLPEPRLAETPVQTDGTLDPDGLDTLRLLASVR